MVRKPPSLGSMIENHTFDEITIGERAHLARAFTADDLALFAVTFGHDGVAEGDHPRPEAGRSLDSFANGAWLASLVSTVLATELPGPGTVSLARDLHFHVAIAIGDEVTATITVRAKFPEGNRVVFDCRCVNQRGEEVAGGTAEVRAPIEKIRRPRAELRGVHLDRHHRFRELLARTKDLPPATVAVAHPCDGASLGAVVDMAAAGLIVPILVGPVKKITAVADAEKLDISRFRLVDAPHSHAAAAAAVALVRAGEAELLMKGSLHTDELMHEVIASDTGLRTERRLSHVYIMDVPTYPRPLLFTDAAINIAPALEVKRDIVQNAIDLARVMGIATPRVAILSAVETVNPKIPSTLDAAALCKMADRGQITGGLVDGPLAFDNAISLDAARQKGLHSPVAGQADILVVPDLEAGNMLAKQLSFLAGASAAGVVVGARVPIILTSRADSERTRIASCEVAVLMARAPLSKPIAGRDLV